MVYVYIYIIEWVYVLHVGFSVLGVPYTDPYTFDVYRTVSERTLRQGPPKCRPKVPDKPEENRPSCVSTLSLKHFSQWAV